MRRIGHAKAGLRGREREPGTRAQRSAVDDACDPADELRCGLRMADQRREELPGRDLVRFELREDHDEALRLRSSTRGWSNGAPRGAFFRVPIDSSENPFFSIARTSEAISFPFESSSTAARYFAKATGAMP